MILFGYSVKDELLFLEPQVKYSINSFSFKFHFLRLSKDTPFTKDTGINRLMLPTCRVIFPGY